MHPSSTTMALIPGPDHPRQAPSEEEQHGSRQKGRRRCKPLTRRNHWLSSKGRTARDCPSIGATTTSTTRPWLAQLLVHVYRSVASQMHAVHRILQGTTTRGRGERRRSARRGERRDSLSPVRYDDDYYNNHLIQHTIAGKRDDCMDALYDTTMI